MKKILSYIYPVTKTVQSECSGPLEITWYNGRKHLNTKNANYSYGSLQRILKYGLNHLSLTHVESILLLGLGGGSVIQTLREDFNFDKHITAVDIDPIIIQVAKDEFGLENSKHLSIICADALDYVSKSSAHFDLIIVDLFIDIQVPEMFLNLRFWQDLIQLKSARGSVLFNAAIESSVDPQLKTIIDFLKTHTYQVEVHENVHQTNTIILAKSI